MLFARLTPPRCVLQGKTLCLNEPTKTKTMQGQVPDIDKIIGSRVAILNKAHLVKVTTAVRAKFSSCTGKLVNMDEYIADNDPMVYVVNLRKVDNALLDGIPNDFVLLDVAGKRPLHIARELLAGAGFRHAAVTWPAASGGGEAFYYAKEAPEPEVAVNEAIAFLESLNIDNRKVV